MIITMDMLENMLAEASSNLDTLVHLSPDRADTAATNTDYCVYAKSGAGVVEAHYRETSH